MIYENNWESLNSRQIPEWFEDAKFGIFIHWGLFSVPAYAPRGKYAEWYGCYCDQIRQESEREYYDYHQKVYGSQFKYTDFVSLFNAQNFDANQWAELFEAAGAKYINFVTKHHDGFCMYPTDYAWNWNSMDVGPHRDFCRELKEACDKTDVKFGIYHSLCEWFHPLYLKNPEEYAIQHLHPMLKELVERYQPYTLFTDGEWDHPSSVWHSTEFLQWLYNKSSVRDYIVPNDRWGRETRGRLGGNLTTEYGEVGAFDGSTEVIERVSEECRGLGASFGWNRFETVKDYLSEREMIRMLVDMVSRGHNFLLNIGPTGDGRIPVIMEERLRQLGCWMQVNGEGIYCSRKYCDCKDENIKYTRHKEGKIIYAFLEKYPMGKVIFSHVPYKVGMTAELLGCNRNLLLRKKKRVWIYLRAFSFCGIWREYITFPEHLLQQDFHIYRMGQYRYIYIHLCYPLNPRLWCYQ